MEGFTVSDVSDAPLRPPEYDPLPPPVAPPDRPLVGVPRNKQDAKADEKKAKSDKKERAKARLHRKQDARSLPKPELAPEAVTSYTPDDINMYANIGSVLHAIEDKSTKMHPATGEWIVSESIGVNPKRKTTVSSRGTGSMPFSGGAIVLRPDIGHALNEQRLHDLGSGDTMARSVWSVKVKLDTSRVLVLKTPQDVQNSLFAPFARPNTHKSTWDAPHGRSLDWDAIATKHDAIEIHAFTGTSNGLVEEANFIARARNSVILLKASAIERSTDTRNTPETLRFAAYKLFRHIVTEHKEFTAFGARRRIEMNKPVEGAAPPMLPRLWLECEYARMHRSAHEPTETYTCKELPDTNLSISSDDLRYKVTNRIAEYRTQKINMDKHSAHVGRIRVDDFHAPLFGVHATGTLGTTAAIETWHSTRDLVWEDDDKNVWEVDKFVTTMGVEKGRVSIEISGRGMLIVGGDVTTVAAG
jgi:hypothetical protein